MEGSLKLDYYYGMEAEQFSFYRIPRLLMKDKRFKELSSDAKLLYGLMLDRLALSMKNGWFDEANRAYIHYTLEDIMEDLGCAKEKGIKVLAELDCKKGIGLIEKKRQGLGRPDLIYVKNFATLDAKLLAERKEKTGTIPDDSTEVRKPNSNYNNKSYTDSSYLNQIHPSEQQEMTRPVDFEENGIDRMDKMGNFDMYRRVIQEQIEYGRHMSEDEAQDRALYEELYEVICETVCVKRKTVKVNGEDYPYEQVKAVFLKLDSTHLEYVMRCMKNTTSKIANIRAYMVTALYNAPATINHYYQQEVQHDMYGGGWQEKGIL